MGNTVNVWDVRFKRAQKSSGQWGRAAAFSMDAFYCSAALLMQAMAFRLRGYPI